MRLFNTMIRVIKSKLQPKSNIIPTNQAQSFTPSPGYDGFSSVSVLAVTQSDGSTESALQSSSIKNGITIAGVQGTYEGEPPVLQPKSNIIPTNQAQSFTPSPGYDGFSSVSVLAVTQSDGVSEAPLQGSIIKDGWTVAGILGSYKGDLATLNAPTISISGSVVTITPNTDNGNFASGYKIYSGDTLIAEIGGPMPTIDLSQYLTQTGTYTITAKAKASGFVDSVASNSKTYLVAPPTNTCLTFQSPSSFTLNVYDNTKHWDGTLYYSTDTAIWNVWSGTTTLSSVGNKLYLRGTGNTKFTGPSSSYKWVLTGTNIECIGNIENLLDYETVALGNHPTMASSCYRYMFIGCTGLTTTPSLPATTLANNCYDSMFRGCTGLTTVPELPATTLTNYCYRDMFRDCTALKVSTTKTVSYQYTWRIPTSGTGTTATGWSSDMLYNTGGTFTGTPTINTTYYLWSE